jgi:hypothetical protein
MSKERRRSQPDRSPCHRGCEQSRLAALTNQEVAAYVYREAIRFCPSL